MGIEFRRTCQMLQSTGEDAPDQGWQLLRGLAGDLWRNNDGLQERRADALDDDRWSQESRHLGALADLSGFAKSPPTLRVLQPESMLESPFRIVWIDIHRIDGRVVLPEQTLSHARSIWIRAQSTGDFATNRAEGIADTVFVYTVHGRGYLVPDLILVGPGLPEKDGSGVPVVGDRVLKLTMSREISAHGMPGVKSQLATLEALADPANWRKVFSSGDGVEPRDRIRKEIKIRLAAAMELLERGRGREAAEGELRVLREAATLLVFRLMFLGEVERRGLLYPSELAPDRHFSEICGSLSEPEIYIPGSIVERFRHVCAAIRGDTSPIRVAIHGASIFGTVPSPAFDPRVGEWLEPFDLADRDITRPEALEWDRLLSGLANVVLGFMDQHQALVSEEHRRENPVSHGVLGVGGAEHAHRMLGEVYEQVLALEPVRKGGKIQLLVSKKEKGDDESKKAQLNERKKLGAHYTPEMLVREMVRPALGLLFVDRWRASGGNVDAYLERLRSLKVVDPAMGSGHYLTVAALEIAREIAHAEVLGPPTAEHLARFSGVKHNDFEAEADVPAARRAEFSRAVQKNIPEVVRRCCHGVDVSALACELGKLSLWLFTLTVQEEDKPELTFLDGNIRCGNSLVGSGWTFAKPVLKQRLGIDLDATAAGKNGDLFAPRVSDDQAIKKYRGEIEALQTALALNSSALRSWADSTGLDFFVGEGTPGDNYLLRKRLSEVLRDRLSPSRWIYDLAVLAMWFDAGTKAGRARLETEVDALTEGGKKRPLADLFGQPLMDADAATRARREAITRVLAKQGFQGQPLRPLHWSLEFPGVFVGERPGFDAVLANPPFIGDRDLRARIGEPMVDYLRARFTAPRAGGTADLAGFFVLLYDDILAGTQAVAATLAPNTLAQGMKRKTVLVPLVNATPLDALRPGFRIARAIQNRVWPGEAAVNVCVTWFVRPPWNGQARLVLDDGDGSGDTLPVARISTFLDAYADASPGRPDSRDLPSSRTGLFALGIFFRGADGEPGDFVKRSGIARQFLADAREQGEERAVFAYLNNDLVQNRRAPLAEEVCVDFFEVLEAADLLDEEPEVQLEWLETNYPFCLAAIDDVRKARQKLSDSGDDRDHKRYWWRHGRSRVELRARWRTLPEVIAVGAVSKVWSPTILARRDPALLLDICPSHRLVLLPSASRAVMAMMCCAVVEQHIRRNCATLETRLSFTPETAFPSFPYPWPSRWSPEMGHPTMLPPPEAAEKALAAAITTLLDTRERLQLDPESLLPSVRPVPKDWGPTELYNRFDNPAFTSPGIEPLRAAHRALLDAVLRQYGWTDLADEMAGAPDHGWAFEKPWIDRTDRYVPALRFREQMLARLMVLNEQRFWEEIDLYVPQLVALLPQLGAATLTLKGCKDDAGVQICDEEIACAMLRAAEQGLVEAGGTAQARRWSQTEKGRVLAAQVLKARREREAALAAARTFRRPHFRAVTSHERHPRALPVHDLRIAAGAFSEGQLPETTDHVLIVDAPKKRGLFVARVVGDSMDKVAPSGTWCLWQQLGAEGVAAEAPGDEIIAMRADERGGFTFKKLVETLTGRVLMPESNNPDHRPIALAAGEPIEAVARFVAIVDWEK